MMTGAKQMRCGGCGVDTFRLFTAERTTRIAVECMGCRSVSYIEPAPATLKIEWDDNADGKLTVF
ncbi:hypothetical protein [Paraburkholderia rhizosphaerae]|uniref:Uncharacterized protein n=1 Tax=Paraburkholderia rhizosphaerae TaxID=480658 RepID=A0A4V3HEM8_9BURK|nr:hypothetical protein [Paraburkholderia rhizosphaerae]TDY48309.1 hypothetical protein BX592_111244 [Paraburkholderia rhizosphaerae]